MINPAKNLLVKQLISEKYLQLLPHFQLVCLETDQQIFRPHETIQRVYFPITAIIALQIDLPGGACTDIVMIGKEGMVGSGVMGSNQNFSRARVRFPGFAYTLPLGLFQSELAQNSAFLKIWTLATRQMILQMALPTLCASKHSNEQQIVRWLMNTLDKTQGEGLHITHQAIADQLGIRRESVSLTAGKLSQDGLIAVTRGHVQVLNRPLLQARACDCYRAMNPTPTH